MLRAWAVFLLIPTIAAAQSREPGDSWLMQNYRFVPGPAPGEIKPVSPTVAQLREVLQTTLSILHKADHDGDYEAALAAGAQATAITQVLGTLTGDVKPPQPPQRPASVPMPAKIWTDGWMLHYLTPEGGHVQVRLDRVMPELFGSGRATPPAPQTSRPASTAARAAAPNR